MRKKVLWLIAALVLCSPAGAWAGMSLATKLHKVFKESAYPHAEKMVGIEINTKVDSKSGHQQAAALARAGKIHEMLVREFNKAGWKDDELATDEVISKNVEVVLDEGMSLKLEETLRMKVFLNQCSAPMRKYRGGDIRAFMAAEVVGEAEYCVAYDNRLEYQKGSK